MNTQYKQSLLNFYLYFTSGWGTASIVYEIFKGVF